MKFYRATIIPTEPKSNNPTIRLSKKLAKKLQIPLDSPIIVIQCSRVKITAFLEIIKVDNPYVKVDRSILQSLFLADEEDRDLLVSFQPNLNTLVIGPVIGLLTEIKEEPPIHLKSIEYFSRELAIFADEIGVIFYVFTLKEYIHGGNTFLDGYILSDNKTWLKRSVPFPNVIHNRLHVRKNEQNISFISFIEELQKHNIPIFNEHFLNKWEVHSHLLQADHLHPFLPTSMEYSFENVKNLIEKTNTLFIKPMNGSQGKQIFKITRAEDGDNWELSYSSLQLNVTAKYEHIHDIVSRLQPYTKKRNFIVQTGIDLIELEGRPVDFRFLCHRRENDTWQVTSAVARVSKAGQFVSNLAQGGEMLTVQQALVQLFDKKEAKHLQKAMRSIALDVCNEISSISDGIFAELGIDITVDKSGQPWLIEVNTKPSKNMDPRSENESVRPSAKAIILYCLYLMSKADET
ncbi:YheC/YheD family endospore coat-associated protein [Bacillus alkalisoli]|uniref:YheC/YheD family endospore coat-associated protein n=1 Tax=Bacillus alkalisoli TaxID=2011008 RepID=UPI000C24D6E9|nr:YheC/YheD family protein [Bacillus alkalisoli]